MIRFDVTVEHGDEPVEKYEGLTTVEVVERFPIAKSFLVDNDHVVFNEIHSASWFYGLVTVSIIRRQ